MAATHPIKALFADALCPNQFYLEPDGYLPSCVVNTYVFSVPLVALTLWGVLASKMGSDGRRSRSATGHAKMLVTILYTALLMLRGPDVFNVISRTVSLVTMLVLFVLSYMDFNGAAVAVKPIELAYFTESAALGYLFLKQVAGHVSPHVVSYQSSAFLCLAAFLAGSVYNICDAVEPNPSKL